MTLTPTTFWSQQIPIAEYTMYRMQSYMYIVKFVLRGHILALYNTGDILKDVNSYEILYDRIRKRWPFNACACLIEVTRRADLTAWFSA
jgi:hypothetical protein